MRWDHPPAASGAVRHGAARGGAKFSPPGVRPPRRADNRPWLIVAALNLKASAVKVGGGGVGCVCAHVSSSSRVAQLLLVLLDILAIPRSLSLSLGGLAEGRRGGRRGVYFCKLLPLGWRSRWWRKGGIRISGDHPRSGPPFCYTLPIPPPPLPALF